MREQRLEERGPVNNQALGNGFAVTPPPIGGGDYNQVIRDEAMMKKSEEIKKATELVAANQEILQTFAMNMGSALMESNRQRQEDRVLIRRQFSVLSPPASVDSIRTEMRTPQWDPRSVNIFTGQAQAPSTVVQPPLGYKEVGWGVDGKPIYVAISP